MRRTNEKIKKDNEKINKLHKENPGLPICRIVNTLILTKYLSKKISIKNYVSWFCKSDFYEKRGRATNQKKKEDCEKIYEHALKEGCEIIESISFLQKNGEINKNIKAHSHATYMANSEFKGLVKQPVKQTVKQTVDVKKGKTLQEKQEIEKAQKVVNEFEKYNFEGRVKTIEIQKAYKTLGL